MDITGKTVTASLNAVAQMVFPFRALETQKQWMRCRMRKPKELLIRKTVATVGRLNNSLPVFPNRIIQIYSGGNPLDIGMVHS
jgi:hypothetical protein